MKPAPNHACPRCGGDVPNALHKGEYPGALSRWDNETEICSNCGLDEAILSLKHHATDPTGSYLAPDGVSPWVTQPTK